MPRGAAVFYFRHFRAKEDLLAAALVRHWERCQANGEAALAEFAFR